MLKYLANVITAASLVTVGFTFFIFAVWLLVYYPLQVIPLLLLLIGWMIITVWCVNFF